MAQTNHRCQMKSCRFSTVSFSDLFNIFAVLLLKESVNGKIRLLKRPDVDHVPNEVLNDKILTAKPQGLAGEALSNDKVHNARAIMHASEGIHLKFWNFRKRPNEVLKILFSVYHFNEWIYFSQYSRRTVSIDQVCFSKIPELALIFKVSIIHWLILLYVLVN